MEELAQFCTECVPLSVKELENKDNGRRLRSIAAMFLGMKHNVQRVLIAKENGSCSVTVRLDRWVSATVQDTKTLLKMLQERPPELGLFAKGCLGFCAASSDANDEAKDRKMAERVNTVLSKAFVIQTAICCHETSVIMDIQADLSIDSARQEFLGCVYDFNKRLGSVAGSSEERFKELLAQISSEYQKRQDLKTEAGKRAFIRWYKAANDMIKIGLQQKVSDSELQIIMKDQKIEEVSIEMNALEQRNKELESMLQNKAPEPNPTPPNESPETLAQIKLLKKENAELTEQLAKKAEIEVLLAEKAKREEDLNKKLEVQKTESARLEVSCTTVQQRVVHLETRINESKESEEQTSRELAALKKELEDSKQIHSTVSQKTLNLETELAARVIEIATLKEQLNASENHKTDNDSNLESLQQQLKAKEEELNELQQECSEMDDELKHLRAKVESYENERSAMTDTMTNMTTELQIARNEAQEKDAKYKSWEAEMKALREQLKEKEDEVVRLLEQNVELEETCRGFQQRISAKEEEIMKVNQQLAELDEETKRTIREKSESVETLERKVKRLTNNLDNAKKDLKSTKAELEEVQNRL